MTDGPGGDPWDHRLAPGAVAAVSARWYLRRPSVSTSRPGLGAVSEGNARRERRPRIRSQ